MTRPSTLSVLDVTPVVVGATASQALNDTVSLAQHAERLGYGRYWLAEHHNTAAIASPAPEVVIAHVANHTSTIRVGSGGIMLPNHSPLKVAETFRVLEALFPGRIDLGLGRAPGTDPTAALALRRSRDATADDFPTLLAELLAFFDDDFPDDHPFAAVHATPQEVATPPIYLLGSSDFSYPLAAALGLGFAFAHHINPAPAVPALRAYRDASTRSWCSRCFPTSRTVSAATSSSPRSSASHRGSNEQRVSRRRAPRASITVMTDVTSAPISLPYFVARPSTPGPWPGVVVI